MKFTINKKILLPAVTRAEKMAASKNVIPVLKEVLIIVDDPHILIISGDGDTYLESEVNEAENMQNGQCCIPAKKLKEVISKMGDVIEFDSNGLQTIIKSGKSKITLSSDHDAEMYPRLPEENGQKVTVSGRELRQALRKTLYAVPDAASTTVLEGLKLAVNGSIIVATGCDRHRLSQTEFGQAEGVEINVSVRGKSLSELEKMLDDSADVELMFDQSYFFAKTGDFTFYSRLLDGTYPDVSRMITTDFKTTVTVNTSDLRMSLERALIVVEEEKTKIVSLLVNGDEMTVEGCTTIDRAIETLDCKTKGDNFKISCNAKYFIDALKTITTEKCTVNFTGSMQPFYILEDGGSRNNVQLILPYRTV